MAVGIVSGGSLIYAKGFGVRAQTAGPAAAAITPQTVFQIGSTTKGFLAALFAIAVDRGKLSWDQRIVDLDPTFILYDPWVTREFRVYDIIAQRSGLPPYVNDFMIGLGYGPDALMRSLRFVPPQNSFRSTFTYTNQTHQFAGRIAARALGAADWPTAVHQEILAPLGMKSTTASLAGIQGAPDRATGYGWTPDGAGKVPFGPAFYAGGGPAGDLNSNLQDCAQWLRMQIADGELDGRKIVSKEGMAATRTPRISITDTIAYAMGWIVISTPNGPIIFHNGGTPGFGAHIGFMPGRNTGMIVLSNLTNQGLPDALALEFYDRILGNPQQDRVKAAYEKAVKQANKDANTYVPPSSPRPPPSRADLVGNYVNDMLGKAVIAEENGDLVLSLDGTGAKLRLLPFDGAVFVARLVDPPEDLGSGSRPGSRYDTPAVFANFEIGDDGRLSRLMLPFPGQKVVLNKE
jgi:CubicO group peptidase (beta-lactamase class C family)